MVYKRYSFERSFFKEVLFVRQFHSLLIAGMRDKGVGTGSGRGYVRHERGIRLSV